MMIVRYVGPGRRPTLGVESEGLVHPMTGVGTVGALLRCSSPRIRELCERAVSAEGAPLADVRPLGSTDAPRRLDEDLRLAGSSPAGT